MKGSSKGCATSGTKTSQATVKRVASGKVETAKKS